jgi:dolichol-phosphate mannosyltransferase
MSIISAVIIPAYNEGNNLKILIPKVYKYNKNLSVYIVDDNSSDNTERILKKLRIKYPFIHLRRKGKLGRGTAVTFGFKQAYKNPNIKIFIEMDADLSHNPKELPKLINLVDDNTIVSASRYISGSSATGISRGRRILSHIVNGFESILLQLPIHDYTNGYRAYPRKAVSLLIKHKFKSTGFATVAESTYYLYKMGFELKETPTKFMNRKIGGSKADIHEMYISIRDLLRIRFSKI